MNPRRRVAVCAALLAVMAAMMFRAATLESQTWDEGLHLTAGFSYWKTGDYRLNREHPPLSKLLCALPLLFTGARMPDLPAAWRDADQAKMAAAFLYSGGADADSRLLAGRSVAVLMAVALGAAIAAAGWRRWGPAAGLTALALYATDSNFLAHGHYITSDVPASLTILLAALAWDRYLTTGARRDLACSAAALGAALATKFSTLFLVPLFWLMYWLRRPEGERRPLVACAGAALAVLLCYGPESWRAMPPLAERVGESTPDAKMFGALADDLRLPAHPFLHGVWNLIEHNQEGHRSYLLGEISERGSRWYFPVAFAVKTPAAALVWIALAAGVCAALRVRPPALALVPAVYAAMCVSSGLNLGHRHLLPVYPFLYLFCGWAAAAALERWRKPAVAFLAAAGLVQAGELARVIPDHTAFFNLFAGGPADGHRYLLDSNLDWGQDLKKLKAWMSARGVERVCLSYFGTAEPAYYGIGEADSDCYRAVSVTNLYDVYFDPPRHRHLRNLEPVAVVGHSIRIFDKVAP